MCTAKRCVARTCANGCPHHPHPAALSLTSYSRCCCPAEHGITTKNPQSAKQAGSESPDISQMSPELQREWLSDRNHHLGNKVVTRHNGCKVWWSCANCPDGHPHIWEATVNSRSYGSGCPYCSGRDVCKHNSLATISPATVQYWHTRKNLPWSPETVTSGSNFRAHWMCPVCLHEWQAKIQDKVQYNSGCPQCAKAHGGRSKDGARKKHPTFASCNHPLLSQWDHDRNAREGNYPKNTTMGSSKRIWWTCDKCPRGKKHSWSARCDSRTRENARGCPFCSGRQYCDCSSLQTLYPELAADFDVRANGSTPDQVTASSPTKYRWLSDKCGAPLRSVAQRSQYLRRKAKQASQAERAAQGLWSKTRKVSISHCRPLF